MCRDVHIAVTFNILAIEVYGVETGPSPQFAHTDQYVCPIYTSLTCLHLAHIPLHLPNPCTF